VDGDSEQVSGWLESASRALCGDARVGIVCGRTRERHRNASIYNRLRDLEAEVEELGGLFMARTEAIEQLGGFRETVIAAEDTELGIRAREAGWRVVRLDTDMAWHDADMHQFTQWWRRAVRSGHAHAEVSRLHGRAPLRSRTRLSLSSWFWGLLFPIFILATAWPTRGASLALLTGYLLLYLRIVRRSRLRGWADTDARLYALSCIAGKTPEAVGQIIYWKNRLLGRASRIIEYRTGRSKAEGHEHTQHPIAGVENGPRAPTRVGQNA
jgi:hypothetical protein